MFLGLLYFVEIDKLEYLSIIIFLFSTVYRQQNSSKVGKALQVVCFSFFTVSKWEVKFKNSNKSGEEEQGRPKTTTTDENINKVHDKMLDDQHS